MEKMKLRMAGLIFLGLILNILAGAVIWFFWQPIASWYFRYRPVLGVDFYHLTSYVAYLSRHFVLGLNGWKYTSWGGGPLFLDYPTFHAYAILPLLHAFSLIQAVQVYVLSSAFLLLVFSYFLFSTLAKDRVLAVVLALGYSFSIGLYGALVWGGSLHYFATQFFLPLVLWLLVVFFKTGKRRFFYLSSLGLGLSLLAHPLGAFSFTMPIAFLLLLTFVFEGEKFFSLKRAKRIFSYFLIAFLVGYPQLGQNLGWSPVQILTTLPGQVLFYLKILLGVTETPLATAGGDPSITAKTSPELAAFSRAQLKRFLTDTHELFFFLLAAAAVVFFLSFLIRKKRKKSFQVLAFALPALWVVFYNSLLGYGISILHGGWYRIFWPFPLALGIFISASWGDFWEAVKERLGGFGQKTAFRLLMPVMAGVITLVPGVFLLFGNPAQKLIYEIEVPAYRQNSSAFPDSLNVYIEKEEFEDLKKRLVPSWLDPNETNYRFYDSDQRINIWWNGLYDIPLVKGYVELPPGDAFSGAFYWTSIALTGNDSLVESWGLPRKMAYNNALFLIDWFSIKYLEAEHEKSDSYNPLTSYLAESDIFEEREKVVIPGWVELYSPAHQSMNWHPEEDEHLTYYQVKDEYVSPILHPTNASVLGFIGKHRAYYTLLRSLAAANLNSRRIIPVRLGEFIDNVSYQDLKNVDAVILYEYDYKNHGKVWGKFEKFVQEGGKVLVETGSDVKQTDSVNLLAKYPKELPIIFPIKMTKQEEIGTNWHLFGDSKETKGINLEGFGPSVIDGEPWLFSLPVSLTDLKEEARVILSADNLPLVVSWKYGEGEVIWSGMNLPYHITTHKSLAEAKFFQNLLDGLVSTSAVSYGEFTAQRQSPNKVTLKGSNAKGVFFRENLNPGWTAKLVTSAKSQKLKLYPAGPTFFGFSYVRLPEGIQGPFTVTFSYQGELWGYFWQLVSFFTILLILDRAIFDSRFLVPFFKKFTAPIGKRLGGWWEKEEEY